MRTYASTGRVAMLELIKLMQAYTVEMVSEESCVINAPASVCVKGKSLEAHKD
jgi:hypothetical protein